MRSPRNSISVNGLESGLENEPNFTFLIPFVKFRLFVFATLPVSAEEKRKYKIEKYFFKLPRRFKILAVLSSRNKNKKKDQKKMEQK